MGNNIKNNIELKTIANLPTYLDNVGNIYPITIEDICVLGENNFYQSLSLLTGNENDFNDEMKSQDITYFQYIIGICSNKEEIKKNIIKMLELLFKNEIHFLPELLCFVVGTKEIEADKVKLIDEDNFLQFQEIIRVQNMIKKEPYKKENTKKLSDKHKELLAKRNRGRKIMEEIKNNGNDFYLVNMINNLGVLYKDINKVLKLNLYQLNMQSNKYFQKETYDKDYEAYLVGADIKKLSLNTHWSVQKEQKSKYAETIEDAQIKTN